jgi:hypothetical protein
MNDDRASRLILGCLHKRENNGQEGAQPSPAVPPWIIVHKHTEQEEEIPPLTLGGGGG